MVYTSGDMELMALNSHWIFFTVANFKLETMRGIYRANWELVITNIQLLDARAIEKHDM